MIAPGSGDGSGAGTSDTKFTRSPLSDSDRSVAAWFSVKKEDTMTATARLTALATLPIIAAWALFAALFCPVIIATAGSLVFGPDTTFYSLIKIVCFLWGAWEVMTWWTRFRVTTVNLIRPTPKPRKPRRPRRNTRRR